jgi:dimethylaniline monooxygenase (N-oxide forming)
MVYTYISASDVVVPGNHQKVKNVCVLGAGVGGLTTTKQLLDEGHKVTVYEQHDHWGGVFYYSEKKGGVYDSTILTISNYFMAFSDAPPEWDEYRFWHHTDYWKYLTKYVKDNQLLEKANFQFETTVERITKNANGKWAVSTVNAQGKKTIVEYDAVAVCSGAHQIPSIPKIPGANYDTNKVSPDSILICHSETFKRAKGDPRFDGRRVVCVGAGETGVDLAHEIAGVTKQCYLSVRRTPMVIPRFVWNLEDVPSDAHTSRAMFYANHAYIESLHKVDQFLKGVTGGELCQKIFGGFLGLGDPVAAKISDLAHRSGGGVTDQFLTKNCNFVRRLLEKSLIERKQIKKIEGKTVEFSDGVREENIDTIVFSTGYVVSFPFLPDLKLGEQGVRSMYKHMFHPSLGDTLAFIGFARPTSGGVPATAEMQGRYFALMCTGSRKLPDDWKKRIQKEADMESKQFYLPQLRTLVFYGEYMETMAQHVRCAPDLWTYLADPVLWFKLQFGAMICAQYRLKGPHAKPELARRVIKKLSIKTPLPFIIGQSCAALLSWVGAFFSFRAPSW